MCIWEGDIEDGNKKSSNADCKGGHKGGKHKKCTHCGKPGHIEDTCFKNMNHLIQEVKEIKEHYMKRVKKCSCDLYFS